MIKPASAFLGFLTRPTPSTETRRPDSRVRPQLSRRVGGTFIPVPETTTNPICILPLLCANGSMDLGASKTGRRFCKIRLTQHVRPGAESIDARPRAATPNAECAEDASCHTGPNGAQEPHFAVSILSSSEPGPKVGCCHSVPPTMIEAFVCQVCVVALCVHALHGILARPSRIESTV